jgi:hypothetical protein
MPRKVPNSLRNVAARQAARRALARIEAEHAVWAGCATCQAELIAQAA